MKKMSNHNAHIKEHMRSYEIRNSVLLKPVFVRLEPILHRTSYSNNLRIFPIRKNENFHEHKNK